MIAELSVLRVELVDLPTRWEPSGFPTGFFVSLTDSGRGAEGLGSFDDMSFLSPEAQALAAHWGRYGRRELDHYLVQDVEHPGVNPQSILVRALLAQRLCARTPEALIDRELIHAAFACHALRARSEGGWRSVLRCWQGLDMAMDPSVPEFLRPEFLGPVREWLDLDRLARDLERAAHAGFEKFRTPFEAVWRERLRRRRPAKQRLRVLEVGGGSANDFRFWVRYGFAAHLEYVGMDLCAENTANAVARHPGVRFVTADACALPEADASHDVVVAFDLLEHLSAEGLERALREMERVSREEVWIACFNASAADAHVIQPVDDYHWNQLSVPALCRHLESAGFQCELVSPAVELERRCPGYVHYSRTACLVVARR